MHLVGGAVQAEVPSLSLPNWVAIMSGVTPEVHGLLGNRAPPEALFSSLTGVARELGIENVLIGTSWFVDLFRSQVTPLSGDGSCSASWEEFEALGPDAANNDLKREQALMMAINGTARLVVAQLSAINSAGHLHGVSYSESAPYGRAVVNKVGVLREVMALIDRQDANITTVILSDHGHLGRGGTGGASGEERDVPLLVHRRGSGLGSAGSCADGNTYTMVDVAPTLAAILRAPAPRHSSGKYIAPIFTAEDAVGQDMGLRTWQWRDLYYQRRAFAEGFLEHPEVRCTSRAPFRPRLRLIPVPPAPQRTLCRRARFATRFVSATSTSARPRRRTSPWTPRSVGRRRSWGSRTCSARRAPMPPMRTRRGIRVSPSACSSR
tara:strand:- start:2590 stop:3729 length:1140 start_codon:yes stop_codon:yes gene_type:complete